MQIKHGKRRALQGEKMLYVDLILCHLDSVVRNLAELYRTQSIPPSPSFVTRLRSVTGFFFTTLPGRLSSQQNLV